MRLHTWLPWLALVLAGLLPALAQAGDLDPRAQSKLASGAYPAPTLHGNLELSLADAIAMGLENNLNIEIQRHQPLIAGEDHEIAWGAYDPGAFAEFGYAEIKNPTANILAGTGQAISITTNRTLDGWGGFRGLVPWLGASYEMRLTGRRNKTDIAVIALSPEFNSEVSFVWTQPLMKNLIWNQPWTLVKTTAVLERAAQYQFVKDVMDTVQTVENAYWGLIADEEQVRVAQKSLETSQALLDQVQTQYEVGVVSRVEISEAEAGVADRDFQLIVARNRYRNSMDQLIDLVLGPNLTADSRIQIVPTDRPDDYVTYEIDVEQSAQLAYRHRPEIAIADSEIERLNYNLRFAKNQRLPSLDAVVTYGNRGLTGDVNPACVNFPTADPNCANQPGIGGWSDSLDDFFTDDAAHQFTARAVVSVPLGNIAGRHGVSKAQLQLRRAQVSKRRVEQDIILEIRRAARDLASAQEGIEAAERREAAATEQLRAERVRLEYGESTPFDVLLREQDLVDAEVQKIVAFQTYRNSVTNLDRFQGTILRNRNVRVEDVAALR